MKIKLILASRSPRRQVLLKKVVPRFKTVIPRVKERHLGNKSPIRNARDNALWKALAVGRKYKNSWVLGADTIVVLRGKILGKPKSLKGAKRMLAKLSGKNHKVITGIALINKQKNGECVFHAITKVRMKRVNSQFIDDYISKVNTLDKAGAYGIQEKPKIIQSIRGSYTNVMGLPLEKLRNILKGFPMLATCYLLLATM